jgi:acetyl-CoA/propionyl-CoA carboxylase biotin carboxyl carrier protein
MFDRVLIANRGEIVVRIARTLRRLGCSPAGVHARGDRGRAALRACDAVVEIGSYLDVDEIVAAALRAGAQALHPGYGFLSERAELARACEAAGVRWIGPPADAIELMGDKSAARGAAVRAGVPVVPGIDRPDAAAVAEFAREHGLPLLVKAAAGGGGRGMRLVASAAEIEPALEAARREAESAFGDGTLLVERCIAPARHIELQVLADAHGTVVDLGERECSLQRRHQKVVEESPSPAVDAALRAVLAREGIALARACGYVGAGTIEFVAEAADPARHYFLEMNTRLQVEHPVTEAVRGVDLVEWQLRVAAGERLPAFPPARGHAIEARIYAEDPARGFLPAAGAVRLLRLPRGPGIRVDAGVEVGEEIGTRYDPMIAKVVAHGESRAQALARLRAALGDTAVLGVRSNVGFLRELLGDERVREGRIDTALVEAMPSRPAPARAALVALIAASLPRPGDPGDAFVALGGWRLGAPPAPVRHRYTVDPPPAPRDGGLRGAGGDGDVEVALAPSGDACVDGEPLSIALLADEAVNGGRLLRIAFDGVSESWLVAPQGGGWWVGSGGGAWLAEPSARERGAEEAGGGDLRAPMPGQVVAVHAQEGARVARGDVLVVMESMKMELQITAPRAGTVAALHVAAGDQVALDTLLATVEVAA